MADGHSASEVESEVGTESASAKAPFASVGDDRPAALGRGSIPSTASTPGNSPTAISSVQTSTPRSVGSSSTSAMATRSSDDGSAVTRLRIWPRVVAS